MDVTKLLYRILWGGLLLGAGMTAQAVEKADFINAVLDSSGTYSERVEQIITEGVAQGFDLNQKKQNRSLFSFITQKSRNPELVRQALQHGGDPNLKGVYGFTPFMFSAAYSTVECMTPLLTSGKADFTVTADNQENVLLFAEGNEQDKNMLSALLQARPPLEVISAPGADGNALIFRILTHNPHSADLSPEQVQSLTLLGELKADFTLRDKEGLTVLQRAVVGSDRRSLSFSQNTVDLLLGCGARVTTLNDSSDNALHFLLDYNLDNENKLRLLSGFCESREALEAPDRDGNTPLLRLFTSKKHSQREDQLLGAMNVLLEKGAHPEAANHEGMNVMMAAAARGCSKCVKTLLERQAPLLSPKAPYPLLFYALTGELNSDTFKALIEAGAEVNAKDQHGLTPLMVALLSAVDPRLVELLVEKGAEVNATDEEGHTALMAMASNAPASRSARSLLKAGVDPNLKDAQGLTALDYLERSIFFNHPKYAKECQEVKAYLTGEKKLCLKSC